MSSLTPSPPPLLVNIPPGHPVFSIDVECVATGVQHNARSIAQVALGKTLCRETKIQNYRVEILFLVLTCFPDTVDEWGRLLFNVFIKQDVPVISYLTELTGITKDILDNYGMPLGTTLLLPPLPPLSSLTSGVFSISCAQPMLWPCFARISPPRPS